ncbi:MAG: NUDIX hydrolase [Firmicutes bacterium]|nr:NUDIX hydrolase [Bacillota bacterium]
MSRVYPERPIAAVGAVIVRNGPDGANEIALVRRGAEPACGRWSIPGGAVELGESVRSAVVREALEECGLEIRPLRVLDVFDSIVKDETGRVRYHYVIVDFLAEPVGGTLLGASDATDARWVDLRRALDLDLTRGTREIIERILAGEVGT